MNEFDIIKHYFAANAQHRADVMHGIGDDSAIVSVPPGQELAITTDTMVAGVHFPETALPYDIGYKILAVNLSDLAAMGATPAWVTLALTLPTVDEQWLQDFCAGFFTLATRFRVQLIGGDMTRGPLSITVQAMGFTPPQKALLRSQAKPSDLIYVTGQIGDAGLALASLRHQVQLTPEHEAAVLERFNRPEPRLTTGEHLRGIASATIDISDGLAADLGHILEQSQVGARLEVEKLPLSAAMLESIPRQKAIELALTGGDDYELCFTVPAHKRTELEQTLASIPCRYTQIGVITAQPGLEIIEIIEDGKKYHGPVEGYEHF